MKKSKNGEAEKLLQRIKRWTDKIYPSEDALIRRLEEGSISIYLGVDPTSRHLHLGHAVGIFVLKEFQDAGHKVNFLIGDFTAQIGDPTDKLSARQPLTPREIAENMRTYKKQAGKIIRFSGKNPIRLTKNSTWLAKLSFRDVIKLAQLVTVQQMIERDMFQDRLRSGKPIGLHEFLYPLMQGYDSVAQGVDLEVGGTDQTFNMLMGRTLAKSLSGKEKFVIALKLLVDPETGKKISKTEGVSINLDDSEDDLFGKVMATKDEMMLQLAEISTDMPLDAIAEFGKRLISGDNPRDIKIEIASYVVKMLRGEVAARRAKDKFLRTFSKKEIAGELPPLKLGSELTLAETVVLSGVAKSNAEAWRLVKQGAVSLDGEVINDPKQVIIPEENVGRVLKVGKRHFFRITK